MKEIVIMACATDPEKRLLTFLKKLFPECTIRVVYAGSEGKEASIGLQTCNQKIGKVDQTGVAEI